MIDAGSVTWTICAGATAEFGKVERRLDEVDYAEWLQGLKRFLCDYFASNDTKCTRKQGNSISPIASGITGAKGLKVRFGFPGCGKSGGLRIAVLALCATRVVKLAGAWIRSEDPADDEFQQAFEDTDR